jgi:formylglycine-generating enzyme required for sulfatase activity
VDADDGFYYDEWWVGLDLPLGHRSAPGEQRFEHWNYSRGRVSWYDVIFFCRWLTAKADTTPDLAPLMPSPGQGMKWRFTQPTEWQWEKAARGHDGRAYPWGKEYISGHANINETWSDQRVGDHYLQKTSAVDMYPLGESPSGIHDLSGNVWEWCLNEYHDPDHVQEGGRASRALRSGSWYDNHDDARFVRRYNLNPLNRDEGYGFRVVAFPVHRGPRF